MFTISGCAYIEITQKGLIMNMAIDRGYMCFIWETTTVRTKAIVLGSVWALILITLASIFLPASDVTANTITTMTPEVVKADMPPIVEVMTMPALETPTVNKQPPVAQVQPPKVKPTVISQPKKAPEVTVKCTPTRAPPAVSPPAKINNHANLNRMNRLNKLLNQYR